MSYKNVIFNNKNPSLSLSFSLSDATVVRLHEHIRVSDPPIWLWKKPNQMRSYKHMQKQAFILHFQ